MSEKVEYEFRVVETEDGFRIEMKGDKDRLRQMIDMLSGFGGQRFGWGGRHAPWGRGRGGWRHGHDPRSHGHGGDEKRKRGYDLGPWWDHDADADDQPSAI
jgi:hypothetical protein